MRAHAGALPGRGGVLDTYGVPVVLKEWLVGVGGAVKAGEARGGGSHLGGGRGHEQARGT